MKSRNAASVPAFPSTRPKNSAGIRISAKLFKFGFNPVLVIILDQYQLGRFTSIFQSKYALLWSSTCCLKRFICPGQKTFLSGTDGNFFRQWKIKFKHKNSLRDQFRNLWDKFTYKSRFRHQEFWNWKVLCNFFWPNWAKTQNSTFL